MSKAVLFLLAPSSLFNVAASRESEPARRRLHPSDRILPHNLLAQMRMMRAQAQAEGR